MLLDQEIGLVQILPIDSVCPSPENEKLYRPIDPADPDVKALAESISKIGIKEPIVVSRDGYIISGHRRYRDIMLAVSRPLGRGSGIPKAELCASRKRIAENVDLLQDERFSRDLPALAAGRGAGFLRLPAISPHSRNPSEKWPRIPRAEY